MAKIKNFAGQGTYIYAHDTAADAPKTGDKANITATLSKDGGAPAALGDVEPIEIGNGVYWFDFDQAETNADELALLPVSATADVSIDPVIINTVVLADYRASVAGLSTHSPADVRVEMDTNSVGLQAIAQSTSRLAHLADGPQRLIYDPATKITVSRNWAPGANVETDPPIREQVISDTTGGFLAQLEAGVAARRGDNTA